MDNQAFVASLQRAGNRMCKQAARGMEAALKMVQEEAKNEAPADTGVLRASIGERVLEQEHEIRGTVYSNLDYAAYVHEGTGIYATNGKGRKKPWKYTVKAGKYKGEHWTRGQKPNPYLRRALERMKDQIPQIIARYMGGG